MEPTQEQIEELRTTFLKELEAKSDAVVHDKDLEKIKNSNDWLRRFLLHHELNQKLALQMLWETVRWRYEFGTNDINETNVRMDYLVEGGMFSHGKDIDGCALFIFKSKKHIKGAKNFEELQRCVVYWFERLERQENGKAITIFFDMEGCGLANMDMEFTKYLIFLFKQYYPYFLNYILIFEMAWILSAAFKIIKSWLPEKAVEKIRFLKKGEIKDYVPLEQALGCWGGNDDYIYSFVPEEITNSVQNTSMSNRKVHFADGSQMSDTGATVSDVEPDGGILSVHPPNIITFVKEAGEMVSTLQLQNTDANIIVSYKMKTTSPEKFRVRPSTGCLKPGASATIAVSLQPGFQFGGLSKDKFLVMSMPVDSPDLSSQDLTELWKNSSNKNISQHRLKCAQSGDIKNGAVVNSGQAPEPVLNNTKEILNSVHRLSEEMRKIDRSVRRLNLYLFFLFALLVVVFGVAYVQLQVVSRELKSEVAGSCFKSSILPEP